MNRSTVCSCWSDLLPELLHIIAIKLGSYVDYIHFRAVCPSWRTNLPNKPDRLLTQLPWLLLPHFNNENNKASDTHCSFFNLADNKAYTLELPEVIGEGKRCWGSPHGWLVVQQKESMFCLLNPLTRSKIQLPSLVCLRSITFQNRAWNVFASLCNFKVVKAVLFANPSVPNFIVMVIMAEGPGSLAFYQSGSQAWTLIPEARKTVFHDIVCFEGKFYIVDEKGFVYVCNLGCSPNLVQIANPPESNENDEPQEKYLVESVRGLLFVYRYHVDYSDNENLGEIRTDGTSRNSTYYFIFHKLDLNELKWTEIDDLEEEVFFLGTNYSFSLSGEEYPSCRKNSVYYTDEKRDTSGCIQGHDVGIFTIDEGDVEALPDSPVPVPYKIKYMLPPPVWVTLSP